LFSISPVGKCGGISLPPWLTLGRISQPVFWTAALCLSVTADYNYALSRL
jgi:hypothetical protein